MSTNQITNHHASQEPLLEVQPLRSPLAALRRLHCCNASQEPLLQNQKQLAGLLLLLLLCC
jgi:hypothetical protein